MAVGPIRFSSVDAYASRYRIDDPDEFEWFFAGIRMIDAIVIDLRQRKTPKT